MRILALIIALTVTPTAWAKVYKCEVNGQTKYQPKPCATGGTEVKLNSTYVRDEDKRSAQQRASNYRYAKARKAAVKEARRQQRIEERREQEKIAKQDAILNRMNEQDKKIKQLSDSSKRAKSSADQANTNAAIAQDRLNQIQHELRFIGR